MEEIENTAEIVENGTQNFTLTTVMNLDEMEMKNRAEEQRPKDTKVAADVQVLGYSYS